MNKTPHDHINFLRTKLKTMEDMAEAFEVLDTEGVKIKLCGYSQAIIDLEFYIKNL